MSTPATVPAAPAAIGGHTPIDTARLLRNGGTGLASGISAMSILAILHQLELERERNRRANPNKMLSSGERVVDVRLPRSKRAQDVPTATPHPYQTVLDRLALLGGLGGGSLLMQKLYRKHVEDQLDEDEEAARTHMLGALGTKQAATGAAPASGPVRIVRTDNTLSENAMALLALAGIGLVGGTAAVTKNIFDKRYDNQHPVPSPPPVTRVRLRYLDDEQKEKKADLEPDEFLALTMLVARMEQPDAHHPEYAGVKQAEEWADMPLSVAIKLAQESGDLVTSILSYLRRNPAMLEALAQKFPELRTAVSLYDNPLLGGGYVQSEAGKMLAPYKDQLERLAPFMREGGVADEYGEDLAKQIPAIVEYLQSGGTDAQELLQSNPQFSGLLQRIVQHPDVAAALQQHPEVAATLQQQQAPASAAATPSDDAGAAAEGAEPEFQTREEAEAYLQRRQDEHFAARSPDAGDTIDPSLYPNFRWQQLTQRPDWADPEFDMGTALQYPGATPQAPADRQPPAAAPSTFPGLNAMREFAAAGGPDQWSSYDEYAAYRDWYRQQAAAAQAARSATPAAPATSATPSIQSQVTAAIPQATPAAAKQPEARTHGVPAPATTASAAKGGTAPAKAGGAPAAPPPALNFAQKLESRNNAYGITDSQMADFVAGNKTSSDFSLGGVLSSFVGSTTAARVAAEQDQRLAALRRELEALKKSEGTGQGGLEPLPNVRWDVEGASASPEQIALLARSLQRRGLL